VSTGVIGRASGPGVVGRESGREAEASSEKGETFPELRESGRDRLPELLAALIAASVSADMFLRGVRRAAAFFELVTTAVSFALLSEATLAFFAALGFSLSDALRFDGTEP